MEEEKRPPSASQKMGLLNDELLRPVQKQEDTKRNTKEFLIDRILSVAEENNLELSISNSKLKRMSKERLQKMLGEMIEEVVKSEMAAAVGAKSGDDSVIALATLRMVHDMLANGVEQGLNVLLPRYGYQVDGFSNALKEPLTSKCVDDCLQEIAAENDVLQYVKSPYARLGIAWSSGLIRALRRAPPKNNQGNITTNKRNYASFMGPQTNPAKNTFRFRSGGRPKTGEVDGSGGPAEPNVKSV